MDDEEDEEEDPLSPIVIPPVPLSVFVEYIIAQHAAPTVLVVCSAMETFSNDLSATLSMETISPPSSESEQAEEVIADEPSQDDEQPALHPYLLPTIEVLASTMTVHLAFCPTLPTLHAYLSALPSKDFLAADTDKDWGLNVDEDGKIPMLAILNPIQAHRDTSAFSAQGLSRFFAAAVDSAYLSNLKLVICECLDESAEQKESSPAAQEPGLDDDQVEEADVVAGGSDEDVAQEFQREQEVELESEVEEEQDLWDEEISLLNVTTKSFGVGSKGWVGRTTTLAAIAERWCEFVELSLAEDEQEMDETVDAANAEITEQ